MFTYKPNTNGLGFFRTDTTTGVTTWVAALPATATACADLIQALVVCFDDGTTIRQIRDLLYSDGSHVYTEVDGITIIADTVIAAGAIVPCTNPDIERREVCFDNGTMVRRLVQEVSHEANGNTYVYYEIDGVTPVAQTVIDAGALVECAALESDFSQETLCVTVDAGARQFAIKRTERATDGTYTTEYFTADGLTALAGTIVEVPCGDDRELISVCLRATVAGTGYAVGDILNVSFVYELVGDETTMEVGQIILNTTQGTTLTAYSAADFVPCENFGTEQISGVYYSDAADAYYTGVYTYNEDGTFAGITYYDDAGAVVTPADATLVGARDYEEIETCLTASVAGAGYAVGDKITKVDFVDMFDTTGSPVKTTVFLNISQGGAVIAAPLAGDTELCTTELAPTMFEKCLCDHVDGSPIVQFFQDVQVATDGTRTILGNHLADNTPYTPVGIVAKCGEVTDTCFSDTV